MVCLRYSIGLVLFSTWVFESSFYLFYLQIFRFFIGWLVAGCHSTCLPSGWILQVWYTENRYPLKYKRHRSAKILLLNICWLFFFMISNIHFRTSEPQFTKIHWLQKALLDVGQFVSLFFSHLFLLFFFASRFQLNVCRSLPSWDLVILLFYIFTYIFYYGPFSFNDFKLQTWSIIWQIRFTLLCLVCVILSTARTPLTSHSV